MFRFRNIQFLNPRIQELTLLKVTIIIDEYYASFAWRYNYILKSKIYVLNILLSP